MKQRHGTAWLPEEEHELRDAFLGGMPLKELARRHQRSGQAIRKRLEKLGLLAPEDQLIEPAATPPGAPPKPLSSLQRNHQIDSNESRLENDAAFETKPEQSDITMTTHQFPAEKESEHIDDPLPDRLRAALVKLVELCVPKPKDRQVAMAALCLIRDGTPMTLEAIGNELGVSRERVRQRRVRAFRCINTRLQRHIASAAKLRNILAAISADTNWADPAQVAPWMVRLISDHFAAVQQLTMMCCKAAGISRLDPDTVARCAANACRDPAMRSPITQTPPFGTKRAESW